MTLLPRPTRHSWKRPWTTSFLEVSSGHLRDLDNSDSFVVKIGIIMRVSFCSRLLLPGS